MTRIIFLDIDGVLNNPGTYAEDQAPWRYDGTELLCVPVDPQCMACLNRLIAATGAKVVMSTSWRLFAGWQDLGPALNRHGLVGEVVGETPNPVEDPAWHDSRETSRIQRGDEVAEWLRRNPSVESFVVLDDDDDIDAVRDRFVQTSGAAGLTDADVERAIAVLTGGAA